MRVYRNGDPPEKNTFAWGSTLEEILQDGSMRLNMSKVAVTAYSTDGQKLKTFDEIKRDLEDEKHLVLGLEDHSLKA